MAGPLAGKTIVVTRPLAQSAPLAEAILGKGGVPFVFPLLDIGPATDSTQLLAAAVVLEAYTFAVFISPNAVAYAIPTLLAARSGKNQWPTKVLPVAVGHGTVRALLAYGVGGTVAPSAEGGRFDSEALLALPEFQKDHVSGRRVAIFRGDGGRELLSETLRARGAYVDCICCYRRTSPAGGVKALLDRWREGIDAFTVSSSEGLRYLFDMLDDESRERLAETPVFVPHARILENATVLGLRRVVLTAAADAGIINGLCDYNWRKS